MDYEKLHKDTIVNLQEMVNSGKITVETARGICADFVPESNDERIRKEILNYIIKGSESLYDVQQYGKERFEKWIAWLEKQGENNMGISEATKQKLEDNLNKALEKETPESYNKFLDEQGEQRPTEWSEEDKMMLQYAIEHFERQKRNCIEGGGRKKLMQEFIDWLKILKERCNWKPSDEQMDALNDVISSRDIKYDILSELWKNLKKLKEE